MSVLSLYIPVIQENISEAYIKKMFKSHDIGIVMRVDFVKNKTKNRREAFIHFDEWFTNEKSKSLQEDIQNIDTKTRFVYTESGKFWPLLANKNAHKRINNPDYEVLNVEEVKNVYKLNITPYMQTRSSQRPNQQRKQNHIQKRQKAEPETYASKTKIM
jgi:hypothetical protein